MAGTGARELARLAGALAVGVGLTACALPFGSRPAAGGAALPAEGRSAALDSLARMHAYGFELRDGVLWGQGAELLREAAAGTRFVALGENHNTRAIPEFAVALFQLLHESYGYDYLALEEGPALGAMLSERVRAGTGGGAFELGREYPNAFHMYTEQELRMIDRIAAISGAAADPVWGVNQEFGIAHVLARLVSIAPDAEARRVAEAFLKRAREYEGERFARNVNFFVNVVQSEDLELLRAGYRPAAGSEADRLLRQVELSHAVYAPYAQEPRPHFTVFHESGWLREHNMKVLFAERYRAAQAAGVAAPKVLVKSGHVHVTRGLGAFHETFTLGNFLSEVATLEGGSSLHIYAVVRWDDLEDSMFAQFMPYARRGTNTVFDLRPMRAWAAHGAFRGMTADLRRVLTGSDMLVILDDNRRGTVDALRTPRFRMYPGS